MEKLFTRFIQHKTAEGATKATLDSYCFALRDFFQWSKRNGIHQAMPENIEEYFVYLRGKSYSQTTLRDKYAVLHACFAWAERTGQIDRSPVKMKKPAADKNRVRCFTDEEMARMFSYFQTRDTFCKLRDYAVVSILFSCGLRRNELLNITACNGDFLTVTGKGRKQRCVPVSASLKRVLAEYIKERNKIAVCPFLVVTRDGKKMTVSGLRSIFKRLSNNTGIGGKRFSAHTFRHSMATSFLRNGGDIVSLSRMLGHSSVSVTEIYLHMTNDDLKNMNDAVNPLNNFFYNFSL